MNNNLIKKPNRIWQYWSEHIILSIILIVIWILFYIAANQELKELPRSVVPFLGTIMATLLGLTFTAFAILFTITPYIRRDYVATDTFGNTGKTFTITLVIQFFTVILSFMAYVFFDADVYYGILLATTFFAVFSMGFLLFLIREMFILFRAIRNSLSD